MSCRLTATLTYDNPPYGSKQGFYEKEIKANRSGEKELKGNFDCNSPFKPPPSSFSPSKTFKQTAIFYC